MVSFGFQEKGDSALFVTYQCSNVVATERYPFIPSGEDVCGYEWVCIWVGCDDLRDVARMSEGSEAWDIGLKVDPAEEESDLVGGPEYFRRRMRGGRGGEGESQGWDSCCDR